MIRFITYHTGFTPTSLIASVAIHGVAILALIGFSSAHNTSILPTTELEAQIFEVAFGPLPDASPEFSEQQVTPPEVIEKEVIIEKPAAKIVKKIVTQTNQLNKNPHDDRKLNESSKTLATDNNMAKSDNTLSSTALSSPALSSSPQQLMNLSSWINRHRFYPSDARRKGEEGTVLMRISFSNTGHLENYQLIKSSGSNTLDRAAAEILKRSAPYPEELVAAFSHAEVPLVFSLRS
jgi:protein TonB